MSDYAKIAEDFVQYYYNHFDNNRAELATLYRDTSMLTFEAQQFQGVAAIVEKLTTLPFQKVQHNVITCDAQPSIQGGALLLAVTGQLMVDQEQHPIKFSQTFQLVPDSGSFYVHNDIFRLNLG